MDVSLLLDGLNDAQREAVAAPLNHTLVLAGAGSGKTRVLVHRIAWLIQVEGVSPHSIMAVTFTNRAAQEMRTSIEELLHIPTRGLWIGTFHSLAHRLLKMHWQEAGLPQNFQILDQDDQLRLVKRVMRELQMDEKKWPAKQVQSFINSQKDEGKRAAHVSAYGDFYLQVMQKVYLAYEEACQRGGMVDFAEILLRSHELWLNNPALLQHYQQRFAHILVDEFQDTNTIQYAWLRVLAGNHSRMMAVGDDDQSIYGWRGAKIENIQQFAQDFQGAKLIRLEQNYRSTQTILQTANAVIANNTGRLGKDLWTDDKPGELIDLYAAFNEYDEARYVTERIRELLKQDYCRRDFAILYRSNIQSRVLEEAFIQAQIPYRIYGGLRFYDRMEIRDTLAYLKLIANRFDDAAFDRVVNKPTRGIGDKSIEDLRNIARDHGCSLWQAIQVAERHKLMSGRALNALLAFQQLIDQLQQATADDDLDGMIDKVIKHSGLLALYQQEKGESAQTRVENLEELVNAASQYHYEQESELTPLQQFLDDVALDAGDNQAEEGDDYVQLMTLHSAKGLEFPFVFMVGLEENLFPSKMSLEESGRLEEERRLCYVGITRAMQQLFMSYAETRRLYGEEKYNSVSRFVRECPQELLRDVRVKPSISRPSIAKPIAQSAVRHSESAGFYLGQRVAHEIFGEGVVLRFEGQDANARVQIEFAEGSKWLVLEYAKPKLSAL